MLGLKTAALALIGVMALTGVSAAHDSINHRERRETARIREGVRSGELTRREAARLTAEQARIRAEEYRYRQNDGRLGPWERADLQRDLNRASRDISRQRHDAQTR